MIQSTSFRGIIAAPHTPMQQDGSLNLKVVDRQAEHFKQSGVIGAFIGGTTGESLSLTLNERVELPRKWAEAGKRNGIRVIAHVGANCVNEAKELASVAESCQLDAIASMAPCFFRPNSVDTLVEYCNEIADSAKQTPFYFYHIPSMTHVQFPMVDFLRVASSKISSLRGMKFTHQDFMDFQECVALEDGRFDVLHGFDECLLAGMAVGARGAVGSTYNFAAPMYLQMMQAYFDGQMEKAAAIQQQSVVLVRTLLTHGFAASAKAVMSFIGVDCGPVRSPLKRLSPVQIADIRQQLDAIGFFSWIK